MFAKILCTTLATVVCITTLCVAFDLKNEFSFDYEPTPGNFFDGPLPAQFDWRDKKVIGPVANQGQIGSSAAFAVLGSLEAQYAIKTKHFTPLSMFQISTCCLNNSSPWAGPPDAIYKCLHDAGGILFASCPKTAGRASVAPAKCVVNKKCLAESVKNWASPASQNETAMAAALVSDGPLVALIDASPVSFQTYRNGVYDDRRCSKTSADHAVLIVGYGVAKNGKQYWIVKNSWGPDWGVGGYIWIARGSNMCGIANSPTNVFVNILHK